MLSAYTSAEEWPKRPRPERMLARGAASGHDRELWAPLSANFEVSLSTSGGLEEDSTTDISRHLRGRSMSVRIPSCEFALGTTQLEQKVHVSP